MPVKSKQEAQFWIHAFRLDDWIEEVRVMLNQKTERTTAFNPICQEYTAGEFRFCCVLGITIDKLGLFDGMGWVWIANNDEHWKEVLSDSHELFNKILKYTEGQKGRPWDEIVTIEPGKEV